jgi:hypothetical protein
MQKTADWLVTYAALVARFALLTMKHQCLIHALAHTKGDLYQTF